MCASIAHRRESLTAIIHHCFLAWLAVIQRTGWASLDNIYVFPDVTGPSSAVPRAVKWFYKVTSCNGLWYLLAVTSFHSVVLVSLPSVWSWVSVQTAHGTACLTPPQLFCNCTAFSTASHSSHMLQEVLHLGTSCKQVCHLYLPQGKGLCTFCCLRSALQPLPSASVPSWKCWTVLGSVEETIQLELQPLLYDKCPPPYLGNY